MDRLPLVVARLAARGCDPKSTGPHSYEALCPCHRGNRRNLSVGVGDSGVVVLHCHHIDSSGRGCGTAEILASLALTFDDLQPLERQKPAAKSAKTPATYRDFGLLVKSLERATSSRYTHDWTYPKSVDGFEFRVVRLDGPKGKTYRPAHKRLEGWRIGDPPGILPLFRCRRGDFDAEFMIITEGEKAACAIPPSNFWEIASPAHGAQSPHRSDWSPCSGRHVVIWPDNDAAGRGFVVRVLECLAKLAVPPASIRVLDPARLGLTGDGDDAADFKLTWGVVEMAICDTPEVSAPKPQSKPLDLQKTRTGEPFANLHNARQILDHLSPPIWYDTFFDRVFTESDGVKRQWIESDTIRLTSDIQRDLIPTLAKTTIADAVLFYSRYHTRDEPLDWLRSLKWDGRPRIERFFADRFGATESEYVLAAGRNFWLSLAARISKPGCQVDSMVVLEGDQGAGKSSAMRAIGGPWFAETSTSPTNKDFYLCLLGKIVIEIAELDSFSRADVTAVKQVITNPSDYYRSPYDRDARDHPRRCIFVGTTNRTDWHRDETGGRRFWPIRVGSVDVAAIQRDRDQLYAEAASRIATGEPWHVMPVEQTRSEQAERLQEDAWEQPIADWVYRRSSVYMADVLREALKLEIGRHDVVATRRAGAILRRLGWASANARVGRKVVKQWLPPPDLDEDVAHVADCSGSLF